MSSTGETSGGDKPDIGGMPNLADCIRDLVARHSQIDPTHIEVHLVEPKDGKDTEPRACVDVGAIRYEPCISLNTTYRELLGLDEEGGNVQRTQDMRVLTDEDRDRFLADAYALQDHDPSLKHWPFQVVITDSLSMDGVFGPATCEAIEAYQPKQDQPPNGA